jgi:hypothetical protein
MAPVKTVQTAPANTFCAASNADRRLTSGNLWRICLDRGLHVKAKQHLRSRESADLAPPCGGVGGVLIGVHHPPPLKCQVNELIVDTLIILLYIIDCDNKSQTIWRSMWKT